MLRCLSNGLLASIVTLAPLPSKAQDATPKNVGERLNSAFGNQDLFDSIAIEFVDKSNASFSCKWWVMKANHQHIFDFNALRATPKELHVHMIGQMQSNMVDVTFPAVKKACAN